MEAINTVNLTELLQRVGEKYSGKAKIFLLGGSALVWLGNPRQTLDIDYLTDLGKEPNKDFETLISQVAAELKLDVEEVPLWEFIPLPPGAESRARLIGQYRNIEAYIFDLYSIALSKIARGFETDLEDVLFLIRKKFIDFVELEQHFDTILPESRKTDIDPKEFRSFFEEIRKRIRKSGK